MRNSLSNQMHCKELNLSPLGFAACAVSYSPDGMSLAVGGTEGQCRTTLQACENSLLERALFPTTLN